MESTGFFMVIPFAFPRLFDLRGSWFQSGGWRIVMRVSVTAELPLDNNCCSDQETKNARLNWSYQPLSQM